MRPCCSGHCRSGCCRAYGDAFCGRTGADAFKALARGADAVCIGRPWVYGLAVKGQAGVEGVLKNLIAELDLTMALSGCSSLADVRGALLV